MERWFVTGTAATSERDHEAATSRRSDQAAGVPTRRDDATHGRWLEMVALAAAVLFLVVTLGPSLVGARTFTVTDILGSPEPWRSQQSLDWSFPGSRFNDHVNSILPNIGEFVDRLWDGDLAWWSPYNNGGAPLASINEGAVFSPLSWPYLVLPQWLASGWSHLLVMLTAVSGTVLFLRRLGLSRAAGLVAGLAFVTSGFMYLNILWPHVKAAAFLPWMFWAVERAIQQRRASSVVPIALVTALLYVGGFPAVAAYTLGTGALYGAFRLVQRHRAGLRAGDAARVGGLSIVAVGLGLGLVAWLILPFNDYMGGIELDYREQTTECHAPERALGSLVFPRYGSDAEFGFECPTGEHDSDAFAGAMVVGLAALGALAPGRHRRGVRTFFVLVGGLSAILTYLGGPLLWVAQQLPVNADNRIMRIRVLLAFALAVLAAFGVDRLREELREPEHRRALAVVAALLGIAALATWRMHTWPDVPMPPLGGWVPFAACLAAGGVFLAARADRRAVRVAALALVPLLVAVEAVAAVAPYWPAGDPDDLYPATTTTDFLADNLGNERFAASDRTLLPNSNKEYGLRSLTGRSFYENEWGDLLNALNVEQVGTRTTSSIHQLPVERVTSPILDRLGVRYYVADSRHPVYGETRSLGGLLGRDALWPETPVVVPLSGQVRAVNLDLPSVPDTGGDRPRIEIELLDHEGDVVGTGSKRLVRELQAGFWQVPVAGDRATDAVSARIMLVDAERPLEVTTFDGSPIGSVVEAGDGDGLQLVHADGTVIYERVGAPSRIRWASDTVVETDPDRRVGLVAEPSVPVSTVLLSAAAPPASGAPAVVDVIEDGGDQIRATVDAEGAGYLVVADVLQRGWRAEVDGEPVELRAADHAVVAVAVPSGRHEVTLTYEMPGQRAGFAIAAASALILAGMALTALRHRRRPT